MNVRDILDVMPHRYPFLLVDKVISIEWSKDPSTRLGNKIVALKNVTINEPFFTGHFPGLPVMPGVLQVEAMAQASCLAFIRPGDPPMDFFIASITEAKFRRMVVPGDTLYLHAEIVKDRGSIVMVRTEARVEGQWSAEPTYLQSAVLKRSEIKYEIR